MNINKTNYGAWFIDYYDGTLSAEKTAELFLFLEQNPDLKSEFESFSPIILDPSAIVFENKELLKKKAITPENIEHYLVADLENDLNLQDKIKLKEFINENPSYEKDKELFRMTILTHGNEVFPDKKMLRKRVVAHSASQLRIWTAAAAILLILLGIIYINRLEERRESVENVPSKNNSINDSLKDFFNSGDELNTEIKQEKTASVNPARKGDTRNESENPQMDVQHFADNKQEATQNFRGNAESIELAEKRDIIIQHVDFSNHELKAPPFVIASSNNAVEKRETLQDKFAEIKDKAAEKINTATGEEILYSSAILDDPALEKIPFKSRMLKFAAWALGKISNDKIKMETTFDQSGNVAAYQVSAGKLKYEKDF